MEFGMYDTEYPVPRQEGRPKRPSAILKNVGLGLGGLGVGYAGLKIGQSAPALARSWQRTAVEARRAASQVTKTAPEITKAATEAASQIGKTAQAWKPGSLMPKISKPGGAMMNVVKKFWRGTLPSQVRKMQSGQALLEFATLDYLRKYLVGEPMLARQGETGWDPGVQAEVEAAALRKPPRSLKAEKMMKAEEAKKWTPRKGYTVKGKPGLETTDPGKYPHIVGEQPGTSAKSIKAGVFKQFKDITTHEKPPEPLPPEMLKGAGGKPAFDPDVIMKGGHPGVPDLWDVKEAAKPTEVKEIPNLARRKLKRPPRDEIERAARHREVSAGAQTWRDPYAFHKARVKAGLTENILVKHETKVPGEPAVRFPSLAKEGVERARAQGIRDVLAAKGWAYRKNVLAPLRAHFREKLGLPKVAPMGREFWKRIGVRLDALRNGIIELEIKPTINIGGIEFHPATIRNFGRQFESDVGKRVTYHKREAEKIRRNLQSRIEQFTSPLAQGRLIREDAEDVLAKAFDPGRTDPIDLTHAHKLATYTGHQPEEIFNLHKAHRRHTHLGETQQGLEKLQKEILPKTLGKVPMNVEKPVEAVARSPLLRRTAIGAGIVGGVGAGAYLVHKIRKNKQTRISKQGNSHFRLAPTMPRYEDNPEPYDNLRRRYPNAVFASRLKEIRFQQTQDAYRDPTPLHQKEIRRWLLYPESRTRALQRGLERVGRLHRDIRAQKTPTGKIIDERGRERTPEWQRPWFKRTVIGAGIVGTALAGRHVYGKIRKASETAAGLSMKNIPLSSMSPGEHAAANITSGHTWRAVKARFPRATGIFTSASERGGGLMERFRQTRKSLINRAAGAVSKFTESQIGELGKGELIKGKSGVIKKVKWDDPAAIRENIERAQKLQKKADVLKASAIAKEERARKAGTTRGTMEEALEKLRKQREEETKTSSLVRLIHFQDSNVYVPSYSRHGVRVKEHYRSERSTQPATQGKQFQRGFLTAAGIAGTGIGTAGGGYWAWNRWRKSAELATQETEATVERRAAEIAAADASRLRRAARAAKKAGAKIIPHKFKSRLREIRFQINKSKQEDQPPAWHDIATGSIEGGLGFIGTERLLRKISERYPVMEKTIPRFATAVGVGGLATGTIGYALNRLIRKKVAARKAAKQQQMSARLRLIKFQDPYIDEAFLPRTRSQRTLVARDRYMKQIHERDIARADRLYKHAALLGGGIGALAARKPATLLKSAGIGAGIGIGVQKAARLYGKATRDPFGERTVRGKRVEQAPEVIGSAVLAGYGLKRLSKYLSSRNRLVRFEEPKRKHNIAAGLAVAATGIPLYRGAGKFARIGMPRVAKLMGKGGAGHQVADYIEASQHVLNQGITGKVAGMALRHPESSAVKWVLGKAPVLGELGGGQSGINKISREHFSAFRSSPTEALKAWSEEYIQDRHTAGRINKVLSHVERHDKIFGYTNKKGTPVEGHLQKLWKKGYNEREAIRHIASDPKHRDFFNSLIAYKKDVVPSYMKQTAGLAAIPATAGLGIAATTRKDRSRVSMR